MYDDIDRDLGEVVHYSGPRSAESTDPNAVPSPHKIEAMTLSYTENRDIRVLRSKGAGWHGRPVIGLRYDGLYRIVSVGYKKNKKGGLYASFKLERRPGQTPLNAVRARPTAQEMSDEKEIRDYY